MRIIAFSLLFVLAASINGAAQDKSAKLPSGQASNRADKTQEVSGKSLTAKSSYLLGYEMVSNLRALEMEVDIEQMMAGIKDAMAGKKPPMSPQEIQAVMVAYYRSLEQKQQQAYKKAADRNLRDGEEFLSANALKEGVKQTESGLQYKIVKNGTGASPGPTDRIKFNFKGMLPDGRVFASTGDKPFVSPAGSVLRGMSEALQRMKVGGKWTVYLPGKLGFGIQGDPNWNIGPNQALIYELELLEIVK